MTQARVPPRHVPTLTEVVDVPQAAPSAGAVVPDPAIFEPTAAPAQSPGPADEEALVQRVLADLQRHIDLMLEYRLRESLTPALARMTDALIHDTRSELASTLREIVAKAVAQELARLRGR